MSLDNRTLLNDCEDDGQTFVTTGAQLGTSTLAGSFVEGVASVDTQHSNVFDDTYTTGDSAGATFNIDMSDMTLYGVVKDSLVDEYASGGSLLVIGDGTDRIGYYTGGDDAVGLPGLPFFFTCFKLDVSVQVAAPESNNAFSGSEAALDQTQITTVGYGSLHRGKAQGSIVNCWIDGFYYIANDSYALTINGGTVGTPETMADVVTDDVASGWMMTGNPLGEQYTFFAPTEWGESAANADHYFTANGEQWYWIGDNGGGHAVGATHFPFRVVGNATDTGSWVVSNTVIVNTGTPAEFLMDDANIDILEMDGCSLTGLGDISAPSSGGTSRFCTNTIFSGCGQITHNGAPMNGSSISGYEGTANTSALIYNETTDPDGEMDEMSFTQGTTATHAIEFGADIPSTITLRGMDFTGYSASDNNDGSVFHFLDTTGTITVNLIDCTAPVSGFSVRDEGATINLVIAPVSTKITCAEADGTLIQNVRVFVETADNGGGSGFPFEAATSSLTQSAGVATLTASAVHGLATNDWVVVRGAGVEHYNRTAQITVTSTTAFTYTVDSGATTPAGGTPVFSYMPLSGLSDVNGEITSSKSWPASQALKGWVRKSTTSPFFKQTAVSISDASGGTDLLVSLQSDE